jgi:hypothetical protein
VHHLGVRYEDPGMGATLWSSSSLPTSPALDHADCFRHSTDFSDLRIRQPLQKSATPSGGLEGDSAGINSFHKMHNSALVFGSVLSRAEKYKFWAVMRKPTLAKPRDVMLLLCARPSIWPFSYRIRSPALFE